MPCTISRDEELYYEQSHNLRAYGVEWTNARLTEAVACELARTLTEEQKAGLPKWALGWIEAHKQRDAERT